MSDDLRLRRWRLALGAPADDAMRIELTGDELGMDRTLDALYDSDRKAGLGRSSPNVARWLGDIRKYFPTSVVKVMQQDAIDRLELRQMLLEPELLADAEPDIHLATTLMSLKNVIPNRTKETARMVVRKVVDDIEKRLRNPLVQAVKGSLNRATRNLRPCISEIDWPRTIRANLRNWIPSRRTVIAERPIGFGRRQSALRDIVLCVDQSGSMASSVVYAGIFGAVLASIRAVRTRMIVFDTAVVDLTDELKDPVDFLFGVQLGGGTDINQALAYCQKVIERPSQTILVLISDLYEGGDAKEMLRRAATIAASGVNAIALLALSDDGAPSYDHRHASELAKLGIPSFACTPDLFPQLMAAAIQKQDIPAWVAKNDLTATRADGGRAVSNR